MSRPRPLGLTGFEPTNLGLVIRCSCGATAHAVPRNLAKGVSPFVWAANHFRRLGWRVSPTRRVEDRCPSCVERRAATEFRCAA